MSILVQQTIMFEDAETLHMQRMTILSSEHIFSSFLDKLNEQSQIF